MRMIPRCVPIAINLLLNARQVGSPQGTLASSLACFSNEELAPVSVLFSTIPDEPNLVTDREEILEA